MNGKSPEKFFFREKRHLWPARKCRYGLRNRRTQEACVVTESAAGVFWLPSSFILAASGEIIRMSLGDDRMRRVYGLVQSPLG
ncbi:unnamed protein product [Caenorhabditis auriculariae]|uniref:Uncharacterized protein n=1 Tax=Caenorhabditis auriculariae TaxID=2777116 RepID=A0A8S1HIE1_9PELO|nr:unnamed protein product [Caenorhabditis auriculariae]